MWLAGRTPLTYPRCTKDNHTALMHQLPIRFFSTTNPINPLSQIGILSKEMKTVTCSFQLCAVELDGYSVLEIFNFVFLPPKTFT